MKRLIKDLVLAYNKLITKPETVYTDSINKRTKYKIDNCIFHTILLVAIWLLLLMSIAMHCYCIKH